MACDFYDKAILHLDESLNNLAFESSEYNVLILIRSKYETRMELLRAVPKIVVYFLYMQMLS